MVIGRRSLLLAGVALPVAARAQCVTDTPAVDACLGGVRITQPPGATLGLSFFGPTLDPSLTFTRGSTATYFDSSGTMQTVSGNTPRFDYDPVTHAALGLLIEEQRINVVPVSVGFPAWALNAATVAGSAGVAPDGTTTVTRLIEQASTNPHYIGTNITIAASTTYVLSVFARAAEARYLQLSLDDNVANGGFATFDLVAGTVSGALAARGTGVIGVATIQAVGGGTYRCSIATTIGAGTNGHIILCLSNVAAPGITPSYAGNASNGLLIWGAQLEAGAFPTSYIPTTAAAVTRSGEFCTAPLGAWYTQQLGTLQVEALQPVLCGKSTTLLAAALIASGKTSINVAGSNVVTMFDTVAPYNVGMGITEPTGVPFKAAHAYSIGAQRCAINGGTVQTNAAGALQAGTNLLGVGNDGSGQQINGYIRRVRYWPRMLSNAELQQVTR